LNVFISFLVIYYNFNFMKRFKLHWQIIIALIAAVAVGLTLPSWAEKIAWIGELFLDALKMVVVPLVMSSIIMGVSGVGNASGVGKLGAKTMVYYMVSSLVAILTGLLLVNWIEPGAGIDLAAVQTSESLNVQTPRVVDIIKGIVPSNLVDAMAKGNVLPVIFFSLLFGYFMNFVDAGPKKTLESFFNGLFQVMMKITLFIIKFTPLGVLALVANEVARNSEQISALAGSLGLYMLVVFVALMVHAFVSLPLSVRLVARKSPLKHLKNMTSALLTAFSTASSGATLPLTMDAVENKSGVSNRITSFTLPLGATVNMDGTALYECVAVMFIAQAYGVDLTFGQQIIVVLTALLASVGAAGIPMAGLVMMTIILTAVNLPLEGVGLILAVDRVLDMMRTAVNVWSDACGAVIVASSEGEELPELCLEKRVV
jgi:proton glutamate symport protein